MLNSFEGLPDNAYAKHRHRHKTLPRYFPKRLRHKTRGSLHPHTRIPSVWPSSYAETLHYNSQARCTQMLAPSAAIAQDIKQGVAPTLPRKRLHLGTEVSGCFSM